jgi:hypothetical protein
MFHDITIKITKPMVMMVLTSFSISFNGPQKILTTNCQGKGSWVRKSIKNVNIDMTR